MKKLSMSVAVVAGGQSRRFGSSKLVAKLWQQRLIDIAIDLAQEISPQILLVANDTNLKLKRDVQVFPDIYKGKGPLAGIHTALTHCQSSWLTVMPVDMPLLTKPVYDHLFTFCTNKVPVVAESEKGLESLVSVWPRETLSHVEDCLKNDRLGIYKCLKQVKAREVDCSPAAGFEANIFTNINYIADLDKLVKRSGLLLD